ncbi:unnamed protein product, partial [Thelazia callipaeda]|uniref:YqaJ domain-containing protein n=1 Tax=Thelazia callipaeda TaxID=103827 RepID=A0A0N5D5V6_THECL
VNRQNNTIKNNSNTNVSEFRRKNWKKFLTVITEQYPKYGYPYCFYPYNQQNGYMQPFIMIKLINLIPNRKVGIECKPTAKDLQSRSIKLWFQMSRFNQT